MEKLEFLRKNEDGVDVPICYACLQGDHTHHEGADCKTLLLDEDGLAEKGRLFQCCCIETAIRYQNERR